jgi:ketosteroid isomerase-like protein
MTQSENPITTSDHLDAAREWFARLSAACAAVDYEAGRAIFADDVASFGTKADIVTGLGPLQRNQWEGIWPNIADFRVALDSVRGGGDGGAAWGIATWTSTGFNEDGASFHRPGRATVALERRATSRAPGGEWLAVHTHFSLNPGTPPRTFGKRRR